MKNILKLESLAEFLLAIFGFSFLPFAWWWFLVLILLPDLSMLGYLFNTRIGAILYNTFHHKGLAILFGCIGYYLQNDYIILSGVILYGHAAMDRVFGYGLKYLTGFKHTHLGDLGN